MNDERHARGQALLDRIGATKDLVESLADIAPDLGRFTIEFAVGDVLARPGVELPTRMLCTIAALTALGTAEAELKAQIAGALNVGCSETEVVEVIMQMAVWAGFPAALNGISAARDTFTKRRAGGQS